MSLLFAYNSPEATAFIEALVLSAVAIETGVDVDRLSVEYAGSHDNDFSCYHRLMLDGEIVKNRGSDRMFRWERFHDLLYAGFSPREALVELGEFWRYLASQALLENDNA